MYKNKNSNNAIFLCYIIYIKSMLCFPIKTLRVKRETCVPSVQYEVIACSHGLQKLTRGDAQLQCQFQ